MSSPEPAAGSGSDTVNEAHLRVVDGPLAAPVLTRVVGMFAARAQCPIDKLDDALLVADAVAAGAPEHSLDGALSVGLRAGPERLELTISGLRPDGAPALLNGATLPGVGNVLERIADDVHTDGEDLVVALVFTT